MCEAQQSTEMTYFVLEGLDKLKRFDVLNCCLSNFNSSAAVSMVAWDFVLSVKFFFILLH